MENEDMDLCTMVAKTLDDYGILYGDLVDNDDGTCNIVGVDESEWEDVSDAIEDGLGLTVDVPDEDHEEFDDELVVHGKEQLGEGTSNEKDTYIVTMTGVSKKDEEELGIVGIRVSYEIPAGSEKEAKQIAKRFDPSKRIVSVELKESLKEENDKTKYFMLDIYGGYNKQELMASDIEVYAKTEKDAMKQAIKIFKDEYDYDPEENQFGLKAVITSSDEEIKLSESTLKEGTSTDKINYNVDDNGVLHIYLGNRILSDVSDCGGMDDRHLLKLVSDTLYGLGYDWNEDGTISPLKESLGTSTDKINNGDKELDETLPETFEGKIDFLAADEEEAIEGYDKVLLSLDGKKYSNVRKQLEIIRDEEVAHKEFLEKVKSDLGTVYVDPNEDKGEEIVDIDTETDESIKEECMDFAKNKFLKEDLEEAVSQSITIYEKDKDGVPEVGREFIAYASGHRKHGIFRRVDKSKWEKESDAKDHISSDGEFYAEVEHGWIYGINFDSYAYVDELGLKSSSVSQKETSENEAKKVEALSAFKKVFGDKYAEKLLNAFTTTKDNRFEVILPFSIYKGNLDINHYSVCDHNDCSVFIETMLEKGFTEAEAKDLLRLVVEYTWTERYTNDKIKEIKSTSNINKFIDNSATESYNDKELKESTKEEGETESLEKMLDDDKYSLEDCMDAYLQEYEDTDIMHYSVLERTAYELEKDGDSEQSKRLLKLLDTNPGVTYFDYYEEEPITSKEWIKKRLAIDESKTKENIKESTKLAEYDIKKDAKPYKTCKGMEYYITPTGDSFTVVTKKENGEFGLGSASGLEFKSEEEAGKWVDHACSLKEGAVSDDTIRKIQDSDAYYMFANDDGDDFLIVDSWDDVHKIQKALEPGFEPRNDYDSSVLDKYFPGSTWGFSDSYDICSKCGKLIRTEPDSYSWEPDFFVNDGELVCGDDVRDDPDAYLKTLYNNPKMANTILTDSDLRNLGFELIKDGYESGMYDRHDDPEEILEKAKEEHPGMTFVFSISSNGQFATRFELWGKEDTDVHESINEGVAVDDPMLRRGISYLDLHRDHFGFLCSYLNRRLHKRVPVGRGFKTEAELLDFVRGLEAQDTGNVDFSVIRQGEQEKYLDALKDDATNLESPKDESYRDSDLIEFEDDMPMTYGQIVEMMDRGIDLDLPAGTDREAIARQYANDYIIERDGHKSYRRALK